MEDEVRLVPITGFEDPDEMPTQRIRLDELEGGEALMAELANLDARRSFDDDDLDRSLEAEPQRIVATASLPSLDLRPLAAFAAGFAATALLLTVFLYL